MKIFVSKMLHSSLIKISILLFSSGAIASKPQFSVRSKKMKGKRIIFFLEIKLMNDNMIFFLLLYMMLQNVDQGPRWNCEWFWGTWSIPRMEEWNFCWSIGLKGEYKPYVWTLCINPIWSLILARLLIMHHSFIVMRYIVLVWSRCCSTSYH